MLKTPVPTGDLQHRLARIVAEQPSVAAHVPTLYREQLHEPEFFDLFFAADMLDLMLTLTGRVEDGEKGCVGGVCSLCGSD